MSNLMHRIPIREERKRLSRTIIAAAVMSAGVAMTQASLAAEPVFAVPSPLGETTVKMVEMAPRLDTLANKTVCMVSNSSFKVDVTNPVIAKALQEKYPGLKIVPHNEMPYTELPGARPGPPWDTFPPAFRAKGCDAIISGNGG
jgi:hypothetical protein